MKYDVIVIGMGLSGLMAAKTAAEMGKRVLILGKGMGGLPVFSNTVDLLGILPPNVKMRDGLAQWIEEHPEHPYGKSGLEGIEEALSSFSSFFPPPYAFQSRNDSNSLVPTGAGTLRPTYLIPSTMMKGVSLTGKKILIFGFEGHKDFYARRLSDALRCRGITLSSPGNSGAEINAIGLARWMEQPSFRETLCTEMKKQIQDETVIGLPAVLGINDPMAVRKDFEKRTGASLFEIPVLPPSIPGMRVFNRFKAKLLERGVTFLSGRSASKVLVKGKRCEGVEVFHPPVTNVHAADQYILATGRFIGGGLKAEREKISEPLFGLPVSQPSSRREWFGRTFFGDRSHSVHRVGLLVDSAFRPVDERGEIVLENVRAVGTILANHSWIDEKSREGIEIATGHAAAKMASGGASK